MKRSKWDNMPQKDRDACIALLAMAGINFEEECITDDELETPNSGLSPWMTRSDAAKYACVSVDTIDNWCAKKYILRAKMNKGKPGGVLIDQASLEKFLRSRIDNRSKRIRKNAPSLKGGYRVQHAD